MTKRAISVALFPSREEKGNAAGNTTTSDKEEIKSDDAVASGEGERASNTNDENKTGEREKVKSHTLESLLDFSFRVQVP